MTQFAVLDALLGGVYSQGVPARRVRTLGDTGIGCCEGLGGEVVLVDGTLFECTADAPPRPMADDEVLPFVDVATLGSSDPVATDRSGLAAFGRVVEGFLRSRNLFHVVRWDGHLDRVRTRVTRRQSPPLRPLAEVAAEQVETESVDTRGSLVGFWMPQIYQGITVAGLHLHFLSADRKSGGHVIDADLGAGALRMTAFADFRLQLPTDPRFLATELSHDEDHRIVVVENGEASALAE
ncbi:acetolactate decarboxylase [Microbacterium sp. NPDC090007]|uniref:acetolactate decarboxylase n=1 Tax=Microbacterium sp. NPDC090007 TaxID=3364204 RepID=UPI0038157E72